MAVEDELVYVECGVVVVQDEVGELAGRKRDNSLCTSEEQRAAAASVHDERSAVVAAKLRSSLLWLAVSYDNGDELGESSVIHAECEQQERRMLLWKRKSESNVWPIEGRGERGHNKGLK